MPVSTSTTQITVSKFISPKKEPDFLNGMTIKLGQGKYEMSLEYLVKPKRLKKRNMSKKHRIQIDGATNDQIWDSKASK